MPTPRKLKRIVHFSHWTNQEPPGHWLSLLPLSRWVHSQPLVRSGPYWPASCRHGLHRFWEEEKKEATVIPLRHTKHIFKKYMPSRLLVASDGCQLTHEWMGATSPKYTSSRRMTIGRGLSFKDVGWPQYATKLGPLHTMAKSRGEASLFRTNFGDEWQFPERTLGISAFLLVQTLLLSKFGHSLNRP